MRAHASGSLRWTHESLVTVKAATGTLPTRYRPPYGVFSSAALGLVRARGLTPMLWSRWGRDWSALQSSRAIARRATRGLAAGDVVLLHDADHYSAPGSWMRTVEALPAILEAAGRLGIAVGTVKSRSYYAVRALRAAFDEMGILR